MNKKKLRLNKLSKEDFVKYIQSRINHDKLIDEIYKLDIGLSLFQGKLLDPLNTLHSITFTKDQVELIDWWLWDAPDQGRCRESCNVRDSKTNEVIATLLTSEDLYDYLKRMVYKDKNQDKETENKENKEDSLDNVLIKVLGLNKVPTKKDIDEGKLAIDTFKRLKKEREKIEEELFKKISFYPYSENSYNLALNKAISLSTRQHNPVLFLSKYNEKILYDHLDKSSILAINNSWDRQYMVGTTFSHIVFHEFGDQDSRLTCEEFNELLARAGRGNKDYKVLCYLPKENKDIPDFIQKLIKQKNYREAYK